VRARAPASAANLGPGFDTLAVALALHVEVEVVLADGPSLVVEGEGADLPASERDLAGRVVRQVAGAGPFAVTVRSSIPVARGLGSSAAVAAAAAAAAGAPDPLAVACGWEGHPENAAAAVLGGLVAATSVEGRPVARPLPFDAGLAFVVLVPTRPLPTAHARQVLPRNVAFEDATFNLGPMGLLLAGLADRRHLVAAATEDRLHQPARGALFPESDRLLAGLVAAGARAACWSGAGPSLLALCDVEAAGEVRNAGARLLAEAGVEGRALQLEADREGLVVGESAP
jgi:homoserine kinase